MHGRNTLILGIGNNLLSDEGIGVHVVDYLADRFAGVTDVSYLDGGTLSFTLAGPIADHANLVVIDAARFGEPPGTLRCLEGDAMDRYLTGNRQSVHEVGLMDLFDIARLSGTFPQRRALIGIEPAELGWGEAPSACVAAVIPDAAALALALVERWRHP